MNKVDDRYPSTRLRSYLSGSQGDSPLPPPSPDPAPDPQAPATAQDLLVRAVLAIALPVAYVVVLVFFAVEWLNFNHPNLEIPVTTGFAALAAWAAGVVFHYIGATSTSRSVSTGFSLHRKE